eukprot:2809014-Rhodomonas_salina.4
MRSQLRKFQQITADNTKEINALRAKRFRLIQTGEESPAARTSSAGIASTEMHEEDEMRRRFRSHANEVPHMDLEDEDQRSEVSVEGRGGAHDSIYPPRYPVLTDQRGTRFPILTQVFVGTSDADSDVDSVTGRKGLLESEALHEEYEDAFLEIKRYAGSIFAPQSMSSWNELPTDR